jgi:hypothetical protein
VVGCFAVLGDRQPRLAIQRMDSTETRRKTRSEFVRRWAEAGFVADKPKLRNKRGCPCGNWLMPQAPDPFASFQAAPPLLLDTSTPTAATLSSRARSGRRRKGWRRARPIAAASARRRHQRSGTRNHRMDQSLLSERDIREASRQIGHSPFLEDKRAPASTVANRSHTVLGGAHVRSGIDGRNAYRAPPSPGQISIPSRASA